MDTTRRDGLLAWQWSIYRNGHRDRANLVVHLVTVPLFMMATCAVPLALALGSGWVALGGMGVMAAAIALQGRTHRREATPPAPFRGPLDVMARIFAEQWVTFPRYVRSGDFARQWRSADAPDPLLHDGRLREVGGDEASAG